jgi:hypothetical protein
MIGSAELLKSTGRLYQGGTSLPSRVGPTQRQYEGIHEDASDIRVTQNSHQTRNFSNPYCPGEFLLEEHPRSERE